MAKKQKSAAPHQQPHPNAIGIKEAFSDPLQRQDPQSPYRSVPDPNGRSYTKLLSGFSLLYYTNSRLVNHGKSFLRPFLGFCRFCSV